MGDLTGKKPSNTYKDLLQCQNANSGIDATLRPIEDGGGTQSTLSLSTTDVAISSATTLDEIATPANPAADKLKIYAVDDGAITKLATLDSAGTETILGTGGATNLAYVAGTRTVTSDTGTDAVITEVVAGGNSGLLTGADKTKLNGIATAATISNLGYTASATDGTVTNSGGTDSTIIAGSTTNASLMLPADKTRLNGLSTTSDVVFQSVQAFRPLVTELTTSKTLALSDANTKQEGENAATQTFTIPTNASVAFPVGTEIEFVMKGAGTVTITGDTGVTLNGVSAGSQSIQDQFSGATMYKTATDIWIITGNIA